MTWLGRIRTWALIAVAVTSAALIYFAHWLIERIASPDWCARAIGAGKTAEARAEYAVGGCFNLLNKQVEALALNSHIAFGVLALCLAVLVVIVLAGGRVNFRASREGVEADISRDVADAAKDVAQAAEAKADEIVEEAKP